MSQLPLAPTLAPDLQAQVNAAVQTQLAALLQKQQPAGMGMAVPLSAAPSPFGAMQQQLPVAGGVLIPLKIPIGQGSVKVHLSFGPEFAADLNILVNLINALGNAGYPVDLYIPKQNGWGNGNGNGNGWGNRGGGWRR